MNTRLTLLILASLFLFSEPIDSIAQSHQEGQCYRDSLSLQCSHKKAWEIGVGGMGYYLTRFNILDFSRNSKGGYSIDTNKRDVIFGGQLYVAHELSESLFGDLQGGFAYATDPSANGPHNNWIASVTLGFEWRLGHYWDSRYIDPYFRIGAGYMYKNFTQTYLGNHSVDNSRIDWSFQNDYNKNGIDRRHLTPITIGTGIHMWLNDYIGIGLQADYVYMPYRNVANTIQGGVSLLWRWGDSKKISTPVQYVEKIREVPKEIIKYIKIKDNSKEVKTLYELFSNIHFDFDKYDLKNSNDSILDQISEVMKHSKNRHYLIIGYTDARGSDRYNKTLSLERAKTVVNALIKRGVEPSWLKYRGVGKRSAFMSSHDSDLAREGDRKVIVEVITNMTYWDNL